MSWKVGDVVTPIYDCRGFKKGQILIIRDFKTYKNSVYWFEGEGNLGLYESELEDIKIEKMEDLF